MDPIVPCVPRGQGASASWQDALTHTDIGSLPHHFPLLHLSSPMPLFTNHPFRHILKGDIVFIGDGSTMSAHEPASHHGSGVGTYHHEIHAPFHP